MRVESTQGKVGFPLKGLARWTIVPAVAVGVLACVIGLIRGDGAVIEAEALAFFPVLVGTALGMLILGRSLPRIPAAWSMVLLFAQGARMISSVSLALVVYLVFRPESMPYWMLFLAASLAVLAGEVAFVLSWIRAADGGTEREES